MNLPLNAGTLKVQAGVVAGVSASLTIAGAYRIRAAQVKRRFHRVELS